MRSTIILSLISLAMVSCTKPPVVKSTPLSQPAPKQIKGALRAIYINASTALNPVKLKRLVFQGKRLGINGLVMDYVPSSPRYRKLVRWAEAQSMRYIPRIVMYEGGGSHEQLTSDELLQQRLKTINSVIELGAKDVQLDYIRYHSNMPPSPENAKQVARILEKIQTNVHKNSVRLQIDIFGIAAHRPSHRIGQDVRLMAPHVDAICPMVYPSHYEPYLEHSQNPYQTIVKSIQALKRQLPSASRVAIYPYLESYNYRFPMSPEERVQYIRQEIKAANDSGVGGWMIWSASNAYGSLFRALEPNKMAGDSHKRRQ